MMFDVWISGLFLAFACYLAETNTFLVKGMLGKYFLLGKHYNTQSSKYAPLPNDEGNTNQLSKKLQIRILDTLTRHCGF